MLLITTPMCEKILEFGKIKEFKVNKNPDEEEGDLAILLSESKVKMNSLAIKLNTFSQIKESIIKVSTYSENGEISDEEIKAIFSSYEIASKWLYPTDKVLQLKEENSKNKVKVYSEFLKDIVKDMNFTINNENYEYAIYPDYLKNIVKEKENIKLIEIPTHNNVSKDPIIRCEMRYDILENIN